MKRGYILFIAMIFSIAMFGQMTASFDGSTKDDYSINTYWSLETKKQGGKISVSGTVTDGSNSVNLIIQEYDAGWQAVGTAIISTGVSVSGGDFSGEITIPANAPISSSLTSGNFYLAQAIATNGEFCNAGLTIIENNIPDPGEEPDSYEWDTIIIPAKAGEGKIWQIQANVSDDFNYETPASSSVQYFDGKWKNEYVNGWTGAGGALYSKDKSHVTGGNLCLENDFVEGKDPDQVKYYADNEIHYINTGNISSLNTIIYPVFAEISAKMNEIPMASDFWMITLDQTQEIDVLEAFGTDRSGYEWWNTQLHLSHHTFIREPLQDYQPRDHGSWYTDNGRRWSASYFRIGVYWKSPFELEYYVDGEMVRSLYHNAVADKTSTGWKYSYQTMNNGVVVESGGYHTLTTHSTSIEFSQDKLVAASEASSVNIIDAYNYLNNAGLSKESYLLFCQGQQPWSGIFPSYEELNDADRSVYKVDWVRVYKPVDGTVTATDVVINNENVNAYAGASLYLKAYVLPSLGSQAVTWKSENTGIATVDEDGLVKCIGAGKVAIVAISEDGNATDTCYLNSMDQKIDGILTFDDVSKYQVTEIDNSSSLSVTCNFTTSTLHVVNKNGIKIQLQQIDESGDIVAVKQTSATDASSQSSGTVTSSIRLRSITPKADLPAGNFYRLYAEYYEQTNMGVNGDTIKVQIDNINIVAATTLTDEVISSDVSIYPNPSAGLINIECIKNARIEVYSIVGIRVLESELTAGDPLSVDLSEFGKGIYIIKVDNVVKRIIVE